MQIPRDSIYIWHGVQDQLLGGVEFSDKEKKLPLAFAWGIHGPPNLVVSAQVDTWWCQPNRWWDGWRGQGPVKRAEQIDDVIEAPSPTRLQPWSIHVMEMEIRSMPVLLERG